MVILSQDSVETPMSNSPYQYGPGGQPIEPWASPKSNPAAMCALIFGLVPCLPITGIAALVSGMIGLRKVRDPGVSGKGMAIAGIILGIVQLIAGAGIAGLLMYGVHSVKKNVPIDCLGQIKTVYAAITNYELNHGAKPDQLADLLADNPDLKPETFICSMSTDTPDRRLGPGHCSFVYLHPRHDAPVIFQNKRILLYEHSENHAALPIVFDDGTATLIPQAQLQQLEGSARR
jgi:hypothetical protein